MKKCMLTVVILLSVMQTMGFVKSKKDPVYREARRNGALAKIELHIADDDGAPVPDAKIKAYLGMNFRPKGTWINGTTNTNGVFVLEGKTCGDEIEVFVTKDGYYDSHVVYCYATMGAEREVKDGKWQPYGASEKILLRKIKEPLSAAVEGKFVHTRKLNEWIGYDLELHDFVSPHGSGKETDFLVSIDWNGKWYPDYSGMGVRLRFTEPYSGYYSCDVHAESDFKGPYAANLHEEYLREARFYEDKSNGSRMIRQRFDMSKCWVVRTRCKVDSEGRLIKANYSVVHRIGYSGGVDGTGGFRVIGAFNPTPNDTNLEPMSAAAKSILK